MIENNHFKRYCSIDKLFKDEEFKCYMQHNWPYFAMVSNNMCLQKGQLGQECGKMRERAILYLFRRFLGESIHHCWLNDYDIGVNEKGRDVVLYGEDVSIKTISYGKNSFNQLKVSWIEDKTMAQNFESKWIPEYDLLLCRIKWASPDEGFYYIDRKTQNKVIKRFKEINQDTLKTSGGYSKGTSLDSKLCEALVNDSDTLKLKIVMPQENRDDNFLSQIFDHLYYKHNYLANNPEYELIY